MIARRQFSGALNGVAEKVLFNLREDASFIGWLSWRMCFKKVCGKFECCADLFSGTSTMKRTFVRRACALPASS